MNRCCTPEKEFIINQGAQCNVIIMGKMLEDGQSYNGVLYHDSRNESNRAFATSIAQKLGDTTQLILEFSAEETLKLKAGSTVILEFYNSDKTKFGYRDNFAKVRPTSLKG